MKPRTSAYTTIAGGVVLMLYVFPHFFLGYPTITGILKDENASINLTHSVQNIWVFSSITMLLCGFWAYQLGYAELKSHSFNKNSQIALGAGITIFAIFGVYNSFPDAGLIIFLLPGLLILVPALLRKK
jgi:hypothetical protein